MTDRLDDLVGAYREVADRPTSEPARTRSRLIRSVHRRHRNQRLAIAGGVLAALLLTNTTTWAWSTGQIDVLARGLDTFFRDEPASPAPLAVEDVGAPVEARVEPEPENADEPALATPSEVPSAPSDEARAARPTARRARPRTVEGGGSGSATAALEARDSLAAALDEIEPPEAIDEAERRAFERAHDAHFGGGTPGSALAAWTTYLARYPSGRFIPEARFNRAICLLRLGRRDEARAGLIVIGEGRYGASRQADARRLVDAIDRGRVRP